MLCAIICYQDDIIHRSTRSKPSLLYFNKLDINNNHLSKKSEYNDHSVLHFPLQFSPNQVDSTTNLWNDVVLTKYDLLPNQKPRSIDLHKLILKKNNDKRKSHLE